MQHVSASVFEQKYPFASELINIEEYFDEFSKSIQSRLILKPKREILSTKRDCDAFEDNFFFENLEISDQQLDELKDLSNIDKLNCEGELESWSVEVTEFQSDSGKSIPENNLASLKEEDEKKFKTKHSEFSLKYKETLLIPSCRKNYLIDLYPFDLKTVIISIRIYSPFTCQKNSHLRIKLLQEFYLLGDQYLTDLKDQIQCNLDHMNLKDVSDDCFLSDVAPAIKDSYPSSFIFIEGTFYNDDRSSDLIDLSEVTKEWLHTRNLGPFNVSTMNEKPLSELPIKVGYPYVYQHQGNCEHIIIFSDLRLLNSCDEIKSRSYPLVRSIGFGQVKHCMMCSVGYAKWLVKENKRLTHDKTYLCNRCFKSYNYVNNAKVGQFKAYEYIDPAAIL